LHLGYPAGHGRIDHRRKATFALNNNSLYIKPLDSTLKNLSGLHLGYPAGHGRIDHRRKATFALNNNSLYIKPL
ncbi:hypothetical protein CP989_25895, partial [Enterobacter hormaechei]